MLPCVGLWLCQMLRAISNGHTPHPVLLYSRIDDVMLVSVQQVQPGYVLWAIVYKQIGSNLAPSPASVLMAAWS